MATVLVYTVRTSQCFLSVSVESQKLPSCTQCPSPLGGWGALGIPGLQSGCLSPRPFRHPRRGYGETLLPQVHGRVHTQVLQTPPHGRRILRHWFPSHALHGASRVPAQATCQPVCTQVGSKDSHKGSKSQGLERIEDKHSPFLRLAYPKVRAFSC